MDRRIFIAINLPDDLKEQLHSFNRKWLELPARWTKKENLHITLFFIGYIKDEELPEICSIVEEIAQKYEPFVIRLKKIIYGPPKKMPPQMIWAEGEKSQELADLQKDLEKALVNSPLKLESEPRAYSSHITLARIKTFDWRKIEPEDRQEVNEDIDYRFIVKSIEIMESELKKGGPNYIVLESCMLKD